MTRLPLQPLTEAEQRVWRGVMAAPVWAMDDVNCMLVWSLMPTEMRPRVETVKRHLRSIAGKGWLAATSSSAYGFTRAALQHEQREAERGAAPVRIGRDQAGTKQLSQTTATNGDDGGIETA